MFAVCREKEEKESQTAVASLLMTRVLSSDWLFNDVDIHYDQSERRLVTTEGERERAPSLLD